MPGIVDKSFLFNPETEAEMTKLTEKVEHFDAWDFGVMVDPVLGPEPKTHPTFLGRLSSSMIRSPLDLWKVRMTEIVNVDAALVQQKVLADVLHGAEHNKQWKDWIRYWPMDVPVEVVPTITEDDFMVFHGTAGSKKRYAGGKFGSVKVDCSEDRGLHTLVLGIKKTWIQDNNWNAVQEATTVAGAAMYKHVATDVCTKLASDAGGTETFDTDLYKTIVKGIGTNRAAGFNPDKILMNPTEETALMVLDKFLDINMLGRVGRLAEQGVIGNFYGTIPAFSTSVCGNNPLIFTGKKAEVLGLRQDIQIEEYNDPIQGLEGAVLTMRYVIECAFAKAIRKCATS
jgi:hypothetical protein